MNQQPVTLTQIVSEDTAGTRYISVFAGQTSAVAHYREWRDPYTGEMRRSPVWSAPGYEWVWGR